MGGEYECKYNLNQIVQRGKVQSDKRKVHQINDEIHEENQKRQQFSHLSRPKCPCLNSDTIRLID